MAIFGAEQCPRMVTDTRSRDESQNPASHDMWLKIVSDYTQNGPQNDNDSARRGKRKRQQKQKPRALHNLSRCIREIYFPPMVIIFQRKNLNDALLRRHKLLTRETTRPEEYTNLTYNNRVSSTSLQVRRENLPFAKPSRFRRDDISRVRAVGKAKGMSFRRARLRLQGRRENLRIEKLFDAVAQITARGSR